jgi:hypothetical protein
MSDEEWGMSKKIFPIPFTLQIRKHSSGENKQDLQGENSYFLIP